MELSSFLPLGRSRALHQSMPCWEQPGREGAGAPDKPAMCPWDKAATGGASPVGWGGSLALCWAGWDTPVQGCARAGVTSTRQECWSESCKRGDCWRLVVLGDRTGWFLGENLTGTCFSCASCNNLIGPTWVLLSATWDGISEGWVVPVWKSQFTVW